MVIDHLNHDVVLDHYIVIDHYEHLDNDDNLDLVPFNIYGWWVTYCTCSPHHDAGFVEKSSFAYKHDSKFVTEQPSTLDLTIRCFRLTYPGHLIRVRLWQHPDAPNIILRLRVDQILHNKSFLIIYWLLLERRTLLPGLKWFCFGFPVPLSLAAGSVLSNFWLMLLWHNCHEWYYFV